MNHAVDTAIRSLIKTMTNKTDEYYMQEALKEARKAFLKDEVPIGCVIVYNDKIIARAYNKRQKTSNVLGHAETIAIKKASKKLNSWILEGSTIYITLEPCLMCAGAILQARIKNVVFATFEPKFGALGSIINVFSNEYKFNHQIKVTSGICKDESSALLKSYFQTKRLKKIDKNI